MTVDMNDILAAAEDGRPAILATARRLDGSRAVFAGWYEVRRQQTAFVCAINHGFAGDLYGFNLWFRPASPQPATRLFGIVGSKVPHIAGGPATIQTAAGWMYLHFEAKEPVFSTFSAETGQWTRHDRGWVGALILPP